VLRMVWGVQGVSFDLEPEPLLESFEGVKDENRSCALRKFSLGKLCLPTGLC
jgi:hypothetical protein